MIRTETVVGAIGGLATGYVLWLVAISIGDDLTTVSVWSLTVLLLSVVLASLRRGVGLVAAPTRQILVGRVRVRPAGTSRGADAGRAGRPLPVASRVVQRDVERGHRRGEPVVLACEQAEFDQLAPVEVTCQLLPGSAGDRPVFDELIRRLQQRLLPGAQTGSRRPSGTSGQAKIVACVSASRPCFARHPAMVLQLVFAGAQMRDPQDHQLGIGRAAAVPAAVGRRRTPTPRTATGADPAS